MAGMEFMDLDHVQCYLIVQKVYRWRRLGQGWNNCTLDDTPALNIQWRIK